MKSGKFAKKAAAVITASALALCACFGGALADETAEGETSSVPSSADKITVNVYNVEEDATVTAYRLVEASYSTYGITGYDTVDALKNYNFDIEDYSWDDVATIAEAINAGSLTLESVILEDYGSITLSDESTVMAYSGDVGAGTWLILVTDTSSARIYNPMLVSAAYQIADNAESLVGGSVNAEEEVSYTVDEEVYVYAKSSEVSVNKSVTSESITFNVGSSVDYKISTQIPSYSSAYDETTLVFKITDTWSEGLDAPTSVTVTVGGTAVEAGDSTYTVEIGESSFVIDFNAEYIANNAGATVTVTYSQILNEYSIISTDSSDGASNSVDLKYTSEPSEYKDGEEIPNTEDTSEGDDEDGESGGGDEVNVYSFMVNGEIKKVDSDGSPLDNTTFTLYTDEDCTAVYTNSIMDDGSTVTDEDGLIVLSGLAEGTYYLKETDAKDGYSVIDTVYTIEIAETTDDGELTSYTVTITGGDSTATYVYELDEETGELKLTENSSDITTIINYTLFELPSTGGPGTAAFTAVGILLIVAAGCVFAVFYKKQKKTNN